jgi:hypothetical protein
VKSGLFRPDDFALGLFGFGVVMLFLPMLRMPGLAAMLAAVAYWVAMVVVKVICPKDI